jgi:DNA-binding beta-propeller fold protein YncE
LTQFRIPGTEQIPLRPRRELGDLAVHPSGDVYVIDAPITVFVPPDQEPTPHRVVRFTSEGEFVQEWGGTGSAPGQFFSPTGIAVGAEGNVLVADAGNQRIQTFAPDGTVLDVWGSEAWRVGERATPVAVQRAPGEALAVAPLRIAVAPDGMVWIGSLDGIRQFASDGAFLRAWPQPRLDINESMAFDAEGNLYVTVSGTMPGHVQVYGREGQLRGDWGITGFPSRIAVDAAGSVYVSGGSDAPLQKFDGQGRLLTSWGGPNPNPAPGELNSPQGIAVDAVGLVYVADLGNHRVQRFSAMGVSLAQWSRESLDLGRALQPVAVAVGPRGEVTILDNRRSIVQVSSTGRLLREWPVTENADCSSVAVDPQGRVYVAADVIRVFDARGKPLASWTNAVPGAGPGAEPWAVAVDAAGHVYVTGLVPNTLLKFTADGTLFDTWSDADMAGWALAVDAVGNVYVGQYRFVQKWSEEGVLLATWGTGDQQEPGYPEVNGVAVDGEGYVYVVEGMNNLVKKFAQRGQAA